VTERRCDARASRMSDEPERLRAAGRKRSDPLSVVAHLAKTIVVRHVDPDSDVLCFCVAAHVGERLLENPEHGCETWRSIACVSFAFTRTTHVLVDAAPRSPALANRGRNQSKIVQYPVAQLGLYALTCHDFCGMPTSASLAEQPSRVSVSRRCTQPIRQYPS